MSNNYQTEKVYKNINADLLHRLFIYKKNNSKLSKITIHKIDYKKPEYKSIDILSNNNNINIYKIDNCYYLEYKSKFINFKDSYNSLDRLYGNLYILIDLKLIALNSRIMFLGFIKVKKIGFDDTNINYDKKLIFGDKAIKQTSFNVDKIYNQVLSLNGIKKYNHKEYTILKLSEYYDYKNYEAYLTKHLSLFSLIKVLSNKAIIKKVIRIKFGFKYIYKHQTLYKRQAIALYKKSLNLDYLNNLYSIYRDRTLKQISETLDEYILKNYKPI